MNSYIKKKNIAFGLISLIGVGYFVFLLSLTAQVWPEFETQVLLVSSAIKIQCDIPQLLSSGIQFANIVMTGILIVLWSKVALSVLRVAQSAVRTNAYLGSLKTVHIQDNIYMVRGKKADAFSAGIFDPRIYISETLFRQFDKRELDSIMHHEAYHCKSYDPLRKIVADFINVALPYFPLKASMFSNYEVLSELAADSYAQAKVDSKKGIISALNKMLDLSTPGLNITGFGLRNDRIHILLGKESFKTRQFFGFIAGVAAIMTVNAFMMTTTNIMPNCKETLADIHSVLTQSGLESTMEMCSFITDSEVRSTYQSVPVRESIIK